MTKNLQIKGMPPEVRRVLEASAAANYRSINQEALSILANHCAGAAQLKALIEAGQASPRHPHQPGMEREWAKQLLTPLCAQKK